MNQIVTEVVNFNSTVITPTQEVAIVNSATGKTAFQTDVRFVDQEDQLRWLFGQFNGGQSDDTIDEEARIDIAEVIAPDVSFTGTHPLLIEQATEIGATDDYIQTCLDEQVARDIFVGGDPVAVCGD